MLQNFRILMPDEVEEMLAEDEQRRLDKTSLMPRQPVNGQQTLTTMANPVTPNPLMKTSSAGGVPMTSPMISQAPDKTPTTALSIKNIKKRDREDFNQGLQQQSLPAAITSQGDLGEIDSIIANLKQRVLLNETLNNFKKEINQIADLIDRRDSTFTSTFANNVAQKLTTVLQKQSQVEILFMLQRTSLLEKRKKKKIELDKNSQLAKTLVERDLKVQNKRAENDYLEIN